MPRHFGWESFAFGFGPRGAFWAGPRRRRRQWFESGDMKYVILKLLKDKPRHGYEVMKEVEGKKIYEVTAAGRAFLEEHQDVVDDIFERVHDTVERALGGAMADMNRAVGRLVKAVYRAGWRSRDEATRKQIAERLDKVREELEALVT